MDDDERTRSDENVQRRLNMASAIGEALSDRISEDNSVVVGWVMIAEFATPSGNRILARLDGSADGHDLPEWQRDGYLINGVKGDWDQPE